MTDLVCDNCATPLPGGSKFCNECGTPVPGQRGAPRMAGGIPTDLRQALQMATAGEYEIHNELGRGGMGSVFLAREIGLDRLVAIKVLPPTLALDEGLIVRFKREARMVAKLHHPNIIPVYRVHHAHNLAFYTMHFVSGRSLNEIMAGGGALTLEQIEKVMMGGAAGLGYAHKRGVIHRDVKPANILMDAESNIHLTDFGIAKALVGNTQLTETGAVIGTPQYMAPEQCDGRPVDGRADQYSLAVVGYQLLTGRPPFEAESMKELLYHHLFTPPKLLSEIRPETPAPLRDTIHKALSKDPADRFDTMEDFQSAIEGKGPPVIVKWIEGQSKRAKKRRKQRRASDLAPTERLPQVPWTSVSEGRLSGYRRAVAALAVAVMSIGAVGILAVTQGAGLAGALRQRAVPDDRAEGMVTLDAVEVLPAQDTPGDGGSSSAAGREEEPRLAEGAGSQLVLSEPNGGKDKELSAAAQPVRGTGQPARRSRSAPATAQPPVAPPELLEELRGLLTQGTALRDVGKYAKAREKYEDVERRGNAALAEYPENSELRRIVDVAGSEIRKILVVCSRSSQPGC